MQRGIRALVYAEKPFVGLASDYPELVAQAMPPGRYPEFIRSWGMDDVRQTTAEALAQHLAAAGITDVGFHDTDTGGWDNPAQWNERTEADRERWGDDYAAATANIYRIYHEALKRYAPGVRMHVVLYPYHPAVFDPAEGRAWAEGRLGPGPETEERFQHWHAWFSDFYARVHALLPPDLSIAMREGYPRGVRQFRTLTRGRGVFWWFAVNSPRWWTLLSEGATWTGTFYYNRDDMIYLTYADAFVPLNSLAVREYAWTIDTPGAKPFGSHEPGSIAYEEWSLRNNSPIAFSHPDNEERAGFLFDQVLPRIARNLCGREASPAVAAAVRQNVDTRQVFGAPGWPARVVVLDAPEDFARQARRCEQALEGLDSLWSKVASGVELPGLDARGMAYLVHLRELFHVTLHMALIREQEMIAERYSAAGEVEAAAQAVDHALELAAKARAVLKGLVAERPANPYLDRPDHTSYSGRTWRSFMADMVDPHFSDAEQRIAALRERLPEVAAAGLAPAELLAMERTVPVRRVVGPPAAQDWDTVAPVENLFVLRRAAVPASAQTRARFLHDEEYLYFRAELSTPGMSVDDRDTLELFLQAGDHSADYVHFFFFPDRRLRHQRVRGRHARDDDWVAAGMTHEIRRADGHWEILARLPLAGLEFADEVRLGSGPWRANIARLCPLPEGALELSSIMDPAADSFHDVEAFAPLAWTEDRHEARLDILALDLQAVQRTLPHAVATVVEFGLELVSNQVLHEATVTVESMGPDGRIHQRTPLVEVDRLVYRWQSPERYDAPFDEILSRGFLRITVQAREGGFVHAIPFGEP